MNKNNKNTQDQISLPHQHATKILKHGLCYISTNHFQNAVGTVTCSMQFHTRSQQYSESIIYSEFITQMVSKAFLEYLDHRALV